MRRYTRKGSPPAAAGQSGSRPSAFPRVQAAVHRNVQQPAVYPATPDICHQILAAPGDKQPKWPHGGRVCGHIRYLSPAHIEKQSAGYRYDCNRIERPDIPNTCRQPAAKRDGGTPACPPGPLDGRFLALWLSQYAAHGIAVRRQPAAMATTVRVYPLLHLYLHGDGPVGGQVLAGARGLHLHLDLVGALLRALLDGDLAGLLVHRELL